MEPDPSPSSGGIGSPPSIAETHSAWVILLGDRAYKLKKPVKLDFLDFSTREARGAIAQREVELNRRLAPDVYLGVSDVLGPDGTVCDHLVVMRRMPDDRRLSTLVRANATLDDEIRQIARVIAAFHARAGTSPAIASTGKPDAIRDKVERDLEEMRGFAGSMLDVDTLDEIGVLIRGYLDGRRPLLDDRMAQGCVIDGHGDLLADDIFCLPDGPRILDCIEFDDRLRYGDVLADVAFLVMDLERIGAAELGAQFVAAYQEFSAEHHPVTLLDYFVASRALIRSKVACIRTMQGHDASRQDASLLLELARDHLRRGAVRLVLIGGAPGTGKSTLAAAIAERLGWVVARSDEVRKELVGLGHDVHAEAAIDEGIYDRATTDATYQVLLDHARHALEFGESVILDASWSRQQWRTMAAQISRETSSTLVELCCDAPIEVTDQRIEQRRVWGDDSSDATPSVAASMRARFESWPDAQVIATGSSLDASLAAALRVLNDR